MRVGGQGFGVIVPTTSAVAIVAIVAIGAVRTTRVSFFSSESAI